MVLMWFLLSMSLTSDGTERERRACVAQNGVVSSSVVEEGNSVKKAREKWRVRVQGRSGAMNTTKHLWAGAIAAMVSRTVVAPLERLKLEYIVRGEQRNIFELVKRIATTQGMKGF